MKPVTAQDLLDSASPSGFAPVWHPLEPLPGPDPACCCSARPMVTVAMPSGSSATDHAEILLCGHHYRASFAALEAAGAYVVDAHGRRLLPRRIVGLHRDPA